MSSALKYSGCSEDKTSKTLESVGSGKTRGCVWLLRQRRSTQNLGEASSFLETSRTGDCQSEKDSSMMSLSNISLICLSISFRACSLCRYERCRTELPVVIMSCAISEVPGKSDSFEANTSPILIYEFGKPLILFIRKVALA